MKKAGMTAWRVLVVLLVSLLAFGMLLHYGRSTQTFSRLGSQGTEVTKIQTKLKQMGLYSGKTDGIYGSSTKKSVVTFQKQQGITADGIAGKQTLQALGISGGSSAMATGGQGKYSNNDIKLLATIVSAEARGEPYEGQVAVASVILNRVEHPSFPNTLAGVIYQPGAFSCLTDGGVNAAVSDSAYKAVRDAINGWDPSGGAIYYYNPVKSTSKWIFSRPVITVIGKHRFCS
ncbi:MULTISPECIES: spore cortex-lytic enzyme [Caproicibacterium]|jgi:N-acetylmuramoyl-L-alanine amidase|uniref:Spore cortex-lytic enzyme n=2 Tax=Caproicibacterium lactatifermentans TaxID=2666138 RepID=A0A859DXI0_9FIRM|nr:spore cortex-lytic enzyme [Caproicibacterium lactatifermentans]ARP51201.1 spore cortex-lytic enzyme [Ruminococcaceae bacterium CPB6]QKN24701.1 spore cortex-lytic enzyme [Caproicibacterium lactatifermentans]QKO30405.1 spore cortex-lytic enzyme [Caproicibacterium lactatifermentans]